MTTVYGIPTCGTCKKARAWLTAHHIEHHFVDMRAEPPAGAQVGRWVATFGAKALRNTSGASYRALGAHKDTYDDAAWRKAFAADPMLIKRPVLERDGQPLAVGFDETVWRKAVGA